MQIEEAKKILKGMFYNDNGEKMHYIDFSDSYGDEWGGYTLPEYIEAIETVLNELEKKEAIINEMVEYMEQEMDEYQLDDIYSELHNCNGMERNWTRGKEAEIKDIKEYFTKKAEEK